MYQSYVVPYGLTLVFVELWGAGGGGGFPGLDSSASGGGGGYVTGLLPAPGLTCLLCRLLVVQNGTGPRLL